MFPDILGSGLHGCIHDASTHEKLRVRKRTADPNGKAAIRELCALKLLQGRPGIVQLLDVENNGTSLDFLIEKFDFSLDELIRRADRRIRTDMVVAIVNQICTGLDACHNLGIIHRDIKPQNILVGLKSGDIKICDFGSCRRLINTPAAQVFTPETGTRWYMPIEVILGTKTHTTAIDMWSLGCVICELHLLNPIFPGMGTLHQLFLILSCTGPVNEEEWPECRIDCPDYGKITFENLPHNSRLGEYLPDIDRVLHSVVSGCFVHSPKRRLTARACLSRLGHVPNKESLATELHALIHNSSLNLLYPYTG